MRYEGPTEDVFIGACSAAEERRSYFYARDYDFEPSLRTIVTAFAPFLRSNSLLKKAEEYIVSVCPPDVREQVLILLEPWGQPEVDLESTMKDLKVAMERAASRGSAESLDLLDLERIATMMSSYFRREPERRAELIDLWQKQLYFVVVAGRPAILAILAVMAAWLENIEVTDSVVDSVVEVAQAWP